MIRIDWEQPVSRGRAMKLAGLGALGLVLAGCNKSWDQAVKEKTPEQLKVMEKIGLLGPHELVDLRSITGFKASGNTSGGILLLSGDYQGQTTTFYEFGWRAKLPNKHQDITTLVPYNKVFFNIIDKKDSKPTVTFGFNLENIVVDEGPDFFTSDQTVGVMYSDLPNDYLMGDNLHRVDFQMTDQQLRQFAGTQNLLVPHR